jgi:hypothetical protein
MQTTQEKITVAKYWFEKLAPKDFLNSEHNAAEVALYLAERGLDTTFDNLTAAVNALGDINNGGRLQFNPKPQVIEKIVYVTPEKTADDIAREKREKFERAHSQGLLQSTKHNRTEFDRGNENKAPILTELEKAKLNAYNENQNQIVAATLHKIQTFTARIHSRTFSGRAELRKVFEDGMNRRLKAEQIEKLVDAKLEKLAR